MIRELSQTMGCSLLVVSACATRLTPQPSPPRPAHVAPAAPTTGVSAPAPAPATPRPIAADPWAGPFTWSETPLDCVPVTGQPPRSPAAPWSAFATGTNATLQAVTLSRSDRNAVWVVGDDGVILHSKDRGRYWSRCQLGVHEALTAVWSPVPDTAWILGAEHVFRLESGKASVLSATLDSHLPGGQRAAVLGADESAVWIVNRRLFASRDRGLTWKPIVEPFSGKPVGPCSEGVYEMTGTPDEFWASCSFNVSRSTDGGESWRATEWKMTTEETNHVSVGPDDVWAGGQDSANPGRSTDHGATFVIEPLPASAGKLWWLWSGGGGWVWAAADGVWVRRGRPGWSRDLPAGLWVQLGGSARDVWAVGKNGLLLHRH